MHCSRVPAKLRASSWWKVCCRIRGQNQFPGLFHPTPGRSPGLSSRKVESSSVQVWIAWRPASIWPPFLREGLSQLFLCQYLRGKWEKAKATRAPWTLRAGCWCWWEGSYRAHKDQRGKVTCLRAPSQDNGRAEAGSHPSRPRAVCATHTLSLLYLLYY